MAEHRDTIRSLALVANQALSVLNFRGPLIVEIIGKGIQVYVLAPDYSSRTRKALIKLGAEPVDISLERTGMHPFRDVTDMLRLARTLRHLKPDATFAYCIKPVIYGTLAARFAGVPHRFALVAGVGYVFTEDGTPRPLRHKILRRLVLRLYRTAFSAAERVFFQNEDDIALFTSEGTIDRDKAMRLFGTGVDLEHYAFHPAVHAPVTFLLAARLLGQKGIREYAAAARKVKTVYPQTRFLLAGGLDPNPDGLSEAEVGSWMREGVLEWPGQVDDVRPWIAQSSVYVLPSYREGMPRSTQEAMAMGRPVITTDSVGCRETVEDGVNGFLVPVRDVQALVQAMLRFIENPSLIESMGRESRRLAVERFDVHKINAVMLQAMGL